MTRRWGARLLVAVIVLLVSACNGYPGLHGRTIIGPKHAPKRVSVAVDAAVRASAMPAMAAYSRLTGVRETVRVGSSSAIARAVKDGATIDLVIIRAGSPVQRIRDELARPPVPFGSAAGAFQAAAVTDRGIRLLGFLAGQLTPPTP